VGAPCSAFTLASSPMGLHRCGAFVLFGYVGFASILPPIAIDGGSSRHARACASRRSWNFGSLAALDYGDTNPRQHCAQ